MPPKQGSAKKKLSKAEKEKLKQEEEERKAVEEEEARVRFEEEEKVRKAQEKEAEAERKKLENAEKENRRAEMLALVEIQEADKMSLEVMNEERRKKAKWARYMRCDGSPDPTIPGEINTYINLRLEDKDNNNIDVVLKQGQQDLDLINELEFLIDDTPESELSPQEADRYKSTMEDLQKLMQVKLDAATVLVLQQATELCDNETFNLHYLNENPDVCLCIWGNLSKNPRIKSFEFVEKGFKFDIPRILTLSDCAFRILFTKYDHFSAKSKSFYPRKKKKEEPIPEIEVTEEEKKEEEEEGEGEKKEGEGDDEGEEGVEKEDTTDLMAMLRQMKGEEAGEEEEKKEEIEEQEENVEEFKDPLTPEPPEWEDIQEDDVVDLRGNHVTEPPEWEDIQEDEDVVDLRGNHVTGGIFYFNLLNLPPQPKTVNSWIITRLVDPPELEYMTYLADTVNPALLNKEGASPNQDKDKEKSTEAKRDEKPPIGVLMRLPDDVLFVDEPQIARWDYDNNNWRLDGFSDFVYDEENRTYQFKTSYFGTMALFQDAHINMPFQSWEIRPHKVNAALFTIIAAISEIEIEIKNSMCCLSKPDDRPELEKIRNKWMTPKELIKTLRRSGLNIFPAEDSQKYVSVQNKHPVIETWCYEQMAMVSSAMAFSYSKWNADTQDREKVLFQACETLEDEPLPEEDWSLFLMTKRRCMKLKMTEFDEVYSEEYAEGTHFKSNMYHLIQETVSEDAKERIRTTNREYIDCVTQILSATKVLSYA